MNTITVESGYIILLKNFVLFMIMRAQDSRGYFLTTTDFTTITQLYAEAW